MVKIISACLIRDLLGSILFLSLERKVDMAEVLSYPLTPVPLSLCHVDDTMLKTKKSTLNSALEIKVQDLQILYMKLSLMLHFSSICNTICYRQVIKHNESKRKCYSFYI